jgi:hypothetical protein
VNALQKKSSLGVFAIQIKMLRRVREQVVGRADCMGSQERQHEVEITVHKFDVVKLEFSCITNCTVKRFLRFIDAYDVAVRILSGTAAHQDALSATKVNFQRVVVVEQLLRGQIGKTMRLVNQVAAMPAIEIFHGGLRVRWVDTDSCWMSSSCHGE